MDQPKGSTKGVAVAAETRLKLSNAQAVEAYLKGKTIPFYCKTKLNKHTDSFVSKVVCIC